MNGSNTPFRVGSVPYVNAAPLVFGLEKETELTYAVPSALPRMLDDNELDVILVSSIESLTNPSRIAHYGCGIASDGAVESVRLLSSVPIDRIESVALDSSSMTSNCLLRILLNKLYGVQPRMQPEPPSLESLNTYDAVLLIGDIGMRATISDGYILDLGEAWKQLTGLPFVWALWTFNKGFERFSECCQVLDRALADSGFGQTPSMDRRASVIAESTLGSGWSKQQTERYLSDTMSYVLGPKHLESLSTFGKFIAES